MLREAIALGLLSEDTSRIWSRVVDHRLGEPSLAWLHPAVAFLSLRLVESNLIRR